MSEDKFIEKTKTGPNYIKHELINDEEFKLFCDYVNIIRFNKTDNFTEDDILNGNMTFCEFKHNEYVREELFIKEHGYTYKQNCSNIGAYNDDWEWFYTKYQLNLWLFSDNQKYYDNINNTMVLKDNCEFDEKFIKHKEIFENFSEYYKKNSRANFFKFLFHNSL